MNKNSFSLLELLRKNNRTPAENAQVLEFLQTQNLANYEDQAIEIIQFLCDIYQLTIATMPIKLLWFNSKEGKKLVPFVTARGKDQIARRNKVSTKITERRYKDDYIYCKVMAFTPDGVSREADAILSIISLKELKAKSIEAYESAYSIQCRKVLTTAESIAIAKVTGMVFMEEDYSDFTEMNLSRIHNNGIGVVSEKNKLNSNVIESYKPGVTQIENLSENKKPIINSLIDMATTLKEGFSIELKIYAEKQLKLIGLEIDPSLEILQINHLNALKTFADRIQKDYIKEN